MEILSYRGPGAHGGVASALTSSLEQQKSNSRWWHVSNSTLATVVQGQSHFCCDIEADLLDKHYAFCNNFLWPVLHDMPSRAHFDQSEYEAYKAFNYLVARKIRHSGGSREVFVNDYQFALVPELISDRCESTLFWHIPWPKHISQEHREVFRSLAASLLYAHKLGFHTAEYRNNFLLFVQEELPEYVLTLEDDLIRVRHVCWTHDRLLKIPVSPLGVDHGRWTSLANPRKSKNSVADSFDGLPYFLSVDRADYTKGVIERFEAIDKLFSNHPELIGKVRFVQICLRTRAGLSEFDQYWFSCKKSSAEINRKWGNESWKPITWIQEQVVGAQLAALYRDAAAMIVSPLRDGLNLTAKEFVACQVEKCGALLLSRGAGVWTELGYGAISVDPRNSNNFAETMFETLLMTNAEKRLRMHYLQLAVRRNSLSRWLHQFSTCTESSKATTMREQIAL